MVAVDVTSGTPQTQCNAFTGYHTECDEYVLFPRHSIIDYPNHFATSLAQYL